MLHTARMWWVIHEPTESTAVPWELSGYETENDAVKAMARYLRSGLKIRALRHGDEVVLDAKDIAKCYSGPVQGHAT